MTLRSDPKGRFPQFMDKALEETGMSVRDLAEKIEASYQHLNTIRNGERQPSERMLEDICKALNLDYDKMLALVVRDKMENQYGRDALAAAFDKSPRIAEYEAYAPLLTPEQHKTVIAMMASLAKSNRKAK